MKRITIVTLIAALALATQAFAMGGGAKGGHISTTHTMKAGKTPGTPMTPGTPGTPMTPGTPGTPMTPGTPGTPMTPGTPGTPMTPAPMMY